MCYTVHVVSLFDLPKDGQRQLAKFGGACSVKISENNVVSNLYDAPVKMTAKEAIAAISKMFGRGFTSGGHIIVAKELIDWLGPKFSHAVVAHEEAHLLQSGNLAHIESEYMADLYACRKAGVENMIGALERIRDPKWWKFITKFRGQSYQIRDVGETVYLEISDIIKNRINYMRSMSSQDADSVNIDWRKIVIGVAAVGALGFGLFKLFKR